MVRCSGEQRGYGSGEEDRQSVVGIADVELRIPDQLRQGIADGKGRGHVDTLVHGHSKKG